MYRRKLIIVAIIGLLSLHASISFALDQMQVSSMIQEVKNIRENTSETNPDVSEVIKKYLLKDQSFEAVKTILLEEGFRINAIANKKHFKSEKYEEAYIAIKYIGGGFWGFLGFGDELRINIYVNKESIEAVKGHLKRNSF